jgi:hypothetical protein
MASLTAYCVVDPSEVEGRRKVNGAVKALLYAAFGAVAWNSKSALLQLRLSFAGAPRPSSSGPAAESPAGAGSAGISDVARVEIHTQAALQNISFNNT